MNVFSRERREKLPIDNAHCAGSLRQERILTQKTRFSVTNSKRPGCQTVLILTYATRIDLFFKLSKFQTNCRNRLENFHKNNGK